MRVRTKLSSVVHSSRVLNRFVGFYLLVMSKYEKRVTEKLQSLKIMVNEAKYTISMDKDSPAALNYINAIGLWEDEIKRLEAVIDGGKVFINEALYYKISNGAEFSSSSIASISYSSVDQVLEVTFLKTGKSYEYSPVKEDEALNVLNAESKGKSITKKIKPNYSCSPLNF